MEISKMLNAETEIFRFFEMTPDLVCIAHKDGYFKNFNQAVVDKLGYTRKELLQNPISSFIHPDDKERTAASRTKLLNGKALINFENRYLTKSGDIIWLHWTSIYFKEKEVVFAIAKDVTEKKNQEEQSEAKYLEFKKLANHFKASLEKDKKTLAQELHEELAQTAAVVKLHLESIVEQKGEVKPAIITNTEQALKATNHLIKAIRRISYAISPQMIEDVGFTETMHWLCKEFQNLSGVSCSFESNKLKSTISPDYQLEIFRICQETLSYVFNQSNSNCIKIRLSATADSINLCIIGKGAGHDMAILNQNLAHTNLRERVATLNGELFIESSMQHGTQLVFTLAQKNNKQTLKH